MATTAQLTEDYHLSLSIGKALWDDLVGAALPLKVRDGTFDLGKIVISGVKQIGVRQRVRGLLEDRKPPEPLVRAKDRAAQFWTDNREEIYQVVNEMFRVEGDWMVEIDDKGTEFHYAPQKIGIDAHVKATINGTAYLVRDSVEIPFTIEKRLGAAAHMGNIRYDKDMRAVVGDVQDPFLDLGDGVVLQALSQAAATLLTQHAEKFNRTPLIKKAQLEEMVAPAGGPLKLKMGIDDVRIEVSENDLQLKVRFAFEQPQLTGE
tara:strand:- start:988 stop:1773 length:786 start_codon:yes stop_codon:yes gene_type:complete